MHHVKTQNQSDMRAQRTLQIGAISVENVHFIFALPVCSSPEMRRSDVLVLIQTSSIRLLQVWSDTMRTHVRACACTLRLCVTTKQTDHCRRSSWQSTKTCKKLGGKPATNDALDGGNARDKVNKFDRTLSIREIKVDAVSDFLNVDSLQSCTSESPEMHKDRLQRQRAKGGSELCVNECLGLTCSCALCFKISCSRKKNVRLWFTWQSRGTVRVRCRTRETSTEPKVLTFCRSCTTDCQVSLAATRWQFSHVKFSMTYSTTKACCRMVPANTCASVGH